IRSMYADQVGKDVLNDLVSQSFGTAIDEHSLDPVGTPEFDVGHLADNENFSFSVRFDVRLEIELKKVEGLEVQKEKIEIDEERIDQVVENMRQSRADSATVFEDRALREGDVAQIDFKGFMNGQPMPNGEAQDFDLEIGSQSLIEG